MSQSKETPSFQPAIFFHTQGCRSNQSETASMIQQCLAKGGSISQSPQEADICIINTCTVTENGDKDTPRFINRIIKENSDIFIALIGCQAQIYKELLADLPNVQWVIGNKDKYHAIDIIFSCFEQYLHDDDSRIEPFVSSSNNIECSPYTISHPAINPSQTRANLNIQDGCSFNCAYCIIPLARGPSRSRVFNDVLKEAKTLSKHGYKEIVITGINSATYTNQNKTLLDLLEKLEQVDGIDRIRLSSIECLPILDKLIPLLKHSSKICPHLHIPLQSGSDRILARMNRPYSKDVYSKMVNRILFELPDICLGTDIIVGFPGETHDDFIESTQLIQEIPFSYIHVFSYSDRPHTKSGLMPNKVPISIKKERSKRLRDIGNEKKHQYQARFLNTTQPVLVEEEKNGQWLGLTPHYLRVKFKSEELNLHNQIIPVSLQGKNFV